MADGDRKGANSGDESTLNCTATHYFSSEASSRGDVPRHGRDVGRGWSLGLRRRRSTVKIAWAESGAQSLMVTHIYEWASNCRPKMARALILPTTDFAPMRFTTFSFVQLAPSMA
jgi:hypothetical protein